MGSENLHHKRKAKEKKQLERSRARRGAYDKVLIVCEGSKTEPNYFRELVSHYRLNTANVDIDGKCGSSPDRVLKRAEELAQLEYNKGDPYDRVYCVFDKDTHQTYQTTLNKIKQKRPSNTFFHSVSVPCFEYWLLLHFKYTTQPFHAKGKSSIADQVLKALKIEMPEYKKGDKLVFKKLLDQLEQAKINAQKALDISIQNNTDNPSTHIHKLLEYLQNIQN